MPSTLSTEEKKILVDSLKESLRNAELSLAEIDAELKHQQERVLEWNRSIKKYIVRSNELHVRCAVLQEVIKSYD